MRSIWEWSLYLLETVAAIGLILAMGAALATAAFAFINWIARKVAGPEDEYDYGETDFPSDYGSSGGTVAGLPDAGDSEDSGRQAQSFGSRSADR